MASQRKLSGSYNGRRRNFGAYWEAGDTVSYRRPTDTMLHTAQVVRVCGVRTIVRENLRDRQINHKHILSVNGHPTVSAKRSREIDNGRTNGHSAPTYKVVTFDGLVSTMGRVVR